LEELFVLYADTEYVDLGMQRPLILVSYVRKKEKLSMKSMQEHMRVKCCCQMSDIAPRRVRQVQHPHP
jgi:hypothetical protein